MDSNQEPIGSQLRLLELVDDDADLATVTSLTERLRSDEAAAAPERDQTAPVTALVVAS